MNLCSALCLREQEWIEYILKTVPPKIILKYLEISQCYYVWKEYIAWMCPFYFQIFNILMTKFLNYFVLKINSQIFQKFLFLLKLLSQWLKEPL